MSTDTVEGSLINKQNFEFGPWVILVQKSHILQSRCSTPSICQDATNTNEKDMCDFCRYENKLQLPQLPEMTFPNNLLHIKHSSGFSIEFNCFDALECVDNKNDPMKVAVAEAWQESRAENSHIKDVVKPFDWTFTTNYMGTLLQSDSLKICDTEERIDIEKLKVKEKILFYEDVILFEDELADNGVAQCSVKIRIMPDSFFVLLRYFLRVDNLCVRVNDTRLYHEVNNDYLLREFTQKESAIKNLKVPLSLLTNPAELATVLPVVTSVHQKLEFTI